MEEGVIARKEALSPELTVVLNASAGLIAAWEASAMGRPRLALVRARRRPPRSRSGRPRCFGQRVGLAPSSCPACYSHRMRDAAARRARARRRWPVLLSSLRNQPSDDLSSSTTLEDRIAMMRPLAEGAWRVAGLPLPRYRRSRIPVRLLVRRGGEETETPLPRRR